jgi:hypothetical protein
MQGQGMSKSRVLLVEKKYHAVDRYEFIIPDALWDLVMRQCDGDERKAAIEIEEWSQMGDWTHQTDCVSRWTSYGDSTIGLYDILEPHKDAATMQEVAGELMPDLFGQFGEDNWYAVQIYLDAYRLYGRVKQPFRLEDVLGFGLNWTEEEKDEWFDLSSEEQVAKYINWRLEQNT